MTVGQGEARTAAARDVRADYIAGLRALADLLDEHGDLPLPYHGRGIELLWIETGKDQLPVAQAFARIVPGAIQKEVRADVAAFDLKGRIGGLRVGMILSRDAVCTRVVTGVREVTEDVPDPDALAAVPTVTVTKTVEDVEWICAPLLQRSESNA